MSADARTRIDEEAGEWLIRQSEGPLSAKEQARFDDWLIAEPAHAIAYAEMARTWDEVRTLSHLSELRRPETAVPDPAAPEPVADVVPLRPKRRLVLPMAVAGALAASIAGALFLPATVIPATGLFPDASHATRIAEQRVLTLADGSRVTLGAASRLKIWMSDGERRVQLASGEAFFDVAHDAARPFFVEAGDTVIRVVGTRFDVNRAREGVRVTVLSGVVRVEAPDRAAGKASARTVRTLTAGQRIETAAAPPLLSLASPPPARPIAVTDAPARDVAAWRDGRLVYDNARLADLVADVNRYYAPGVTLDASARDLRVTASFATAEIPAFMATLATALPVDVERKADGGYRIARP